MTKQLFEVQFRVHPTPDHPQFDQIKFGIFVLWLYEADEKQAARKARYIMTALPYTVGDCKISKVAEGDKLYPYQINHVSMARLAGISMLLFHWPPECDETTVLHDWPFLVPPLSLPDKGLGAPHD